MAFFKKYLLAPLLLLLLGAAFFGGYWAASHTLWAQRIAPRFRGEAEYPCGQVTAILSSANTLSEESLYTLHTALDSAYVSASLTAPENGSLYKDAWCCEAAVSVSGDKGSATVKALGVGGDWFYFHPLRLRSGSTISDADFARDTVVLDRELAWRLFGSVDVTGMTLTINDQPFVVSGVVYRDEDLFTHTAESAQEKDTVTGLYVNWQSLMVLGDVTPAAYELVGADPISSFLKEQVEKGFSGAPVVKNDGRYDPLRLWEVLVTLPQVTMRTDGLVYPVWENAARVSEVTAALLLLGAVLCAVYPLICLIRALVRGVKAGTKAVAEGVPTLLDRISERRWERKQKRKGRK